MSISKEDIEYTAKLAKLYFDGEEKKSLMKNLNDILKYVEKLDELDTENINITVNPYYMENQYREDEIQESLPLNKVMENCPNWQEDYVVVPKVIE